jgi:hypothetical protein
MKIGCERWVEIMGAIDGLPWTCEINGGESSWAALEPPIGESFTGYGRP